jgi:hypothetical protein
MLVNDYKWAVLLFRNDGAALGSAAVTVDWDPAAEWTRFYHARRGTTAFGDGGTASILPLWDRSQGEPYLRGFRVVLDPNGGGPVSSDFPSSYFAEVASQASDELLKLGKLEAGETYLYQAVAFRSEGRGQPSNGLQLAVVEERPVVGLAESALAPWLRRATASGVVDADDLPVFVPRRVLDEAAGLTRAADGKETGGTLIGHLYRDPSLPEIFAVVTGQIPAEHAEGGVAKLTFTADTWTAANRVIRLRNRDEAFLGYWHSHPVREWCKAKECTPEKQRDCRLAKDFFSQDDKAVMRAAFPRSYSLGLVVNDTAFADLTYSLFGWREGKIHPRGFYLMEESDA